MNAACVLCLLATGLLSAPQDPAPAIHPRPDPLTPLINAERANRENLPTSGEIRFLSREGSADPIDLESLEDLPRVTMRITTEIPGRFLFSGPNRFFECVDPAFLTNGPIDPAAVQKVNVDLSTRLLTNGERTLKHRLLYVESQNTLQSSLSIQNGTQAFTSNVFLPLPLADAIPGVTELAYLASLIQSGKMKLDSIDYKATLHGQPMILVQSSGDRLLKRFWIDPEHGAIPRLVSSLTWPEPVSNPNSPGGRVMLFECSDLHQLSTGAWYPFRLRRVHAQREGAGHYKTINLREVLITDYREVPIDSAQMRIDLGTEQTAFNQTTSRAYPKRKTWDLAAISSASEAAASPVPRADPSVRPPPQMPGTRPAPTPWWHAWPWFLAGAACLLIGFVLRNRFRA
jgi:hypothetical protein